jgi:hypothetical protein
MTDIIQEVEKEFETVTHAIADTIQHVTEIIQGGEKVVADLTSFSLIDLLTEALKRLTVEQPETTPASEPTPTPEVQN